MKATALTALGAVGLFVLGLLAQAFTSWLAGRATVRERKAQRKLARQDRREAFELETLRGIEVALETYVLIQTGRLAKKKSAFDKTGQWVSLDSYDDLLEALRATRELDRLKWQLFDEKTRDAISAVENGLAGALKKFDDDPTDGEAKERAEDLYVLATAALELADKIISSRIRELHEEPEE